MVRAFLLILCLSVIAWADMSSIPTDIQDKLTILFKGYYPEIHKAATWLFWTLAFFEMVFVFGFMAMRQELEFGGIMAQLVKIFLLWGLFSLLLDNWGYMKSIFQGFSELGFKTSDVSLDKIVGLIVDMWKFIWDKGSIVSASNNLIVLAIIGLAATYAIAILVGHALQYFAFSVLSIYVGIFFLAFGAWSETRSWARNAIVQPIRYGAKYMLTMILMSVVFAMIKDVMVDPKISNFITLLFVSFILVTISSGVSGFIDGILSGNGGGENNRGVQMAAVAASMASSAASTAAGGIAGGIAGAMAGGLTASDTIKAARASGADAAKEAGVGGISSNISKGEAFKSIMNGMAGGMMSGGKAGAESGMFTGAFSGGSAGADKGSAAGGKVAEAFAKDLKAELAQKTSDKGEDKGASGTVGSGSKS